MKSVLLGVLLIFYTTIFAQNLYKISFENFSYIMDERTRRGSVNSKIHVYVNYTDGTQDVLYAHSLPNKDRYNEYDYNHTVHTSKKPSHISYYIFINWKKGDPTRVNSYFRRNINTCSNTTFSEYFSSKLKNFKYKLKVTPLHTLKRDIKDGIEETFLPTNNKVKLFAKTDFPEELYHYQYSLDNSIWVDIPSSLYNKETLTLSAKDLFGNQVANYLGKKVWFRVVACPDGSGNYQSWSDSVFLTVVESSPHISTHTVSPVTCSDSEDGKIRLNFDRTLKTGETLEFALTNTDTGVIVNNYDATAVLRAETSYSIESLAPGKYKLNSRGIYNGNLTYTDGSQHSVEFEVKNQTL